MPAGGGAAARAAAGQRVPDAGDDAEQPGEPLRSRRYAENAFLRHFIPKTLCLPRRARAIHREHTCTQKETCFLEAGKHAVALKLYERVVLIKKAAFGAESRAVKATTQEMVKISQVLWEAEHPD